MVCAGLCRVFPRARHVLPAELGAARAAARRRADRRRCCAPARRARLEAIPGWVWVARVARVVRRPLAADKNKAWAMTCALVEAYVAEHGKMPAKSYKTVDGISLGVWVSTQRQRRDKLSDERRARFDALLQ